MSRSLVGSSSSRTLGWRRTRRSTCSRRRSPPDRSLIRATSRSPVKPNRSSRLDAVTSPVVVRLTRAISSTESSTRWPSSRSARSWVSSPRSTVRPILTLPRSGASEPPTSRSRLVLPTPLTPTSPTRSPGPSRQVTSRSTSLSPRRQRDVLEVDDVLAEPGRSEPLQRHPVARRRLALDDRVGGLDPELRLGGAGRRPAAQPGQLLAGQVLAPGLLRAGLAVALGPGQHVRRVAAVVRIDHAVVQLPGRRRHRVQEPPVVGHDDERAGQRRAAAGPASRRPRRPGGWSARPGPPGRAG